ncbi:MAG: insulinase family protein [Lentisphaeria bacterium]|nr:insulinase family protein [Lentisphaeria bacterium]
MTLQLGRVFRGFRISSVGRVEDLDCDFVRAVHIASGTQILHLNAADSENLFGICFPTWPADDTGVAHILEHVVLGGSQRFPLKDPFAEMLKSSMATFLNACTYADRTVYPVSSCVRADFFHLAEVYLDAVFQPVLDRFSFMQEGHHLELGEESGLGATRLRVGGIVYNEMRGALEEPEAIIAEESLRGLYPDSPYRFESGGRPEHIVELTYESFVDFYRRCYSPSKALVFLYGDIPTERHLDFLDGLLPPCSEPAEPAVQLPAPQQRWSVPRRAEIPITADSDLPLGEQSAVTLNWIVGHVSEPVTDLAFELLEHALLGDAGAPLRKAMLDSRLGHDLVNCGYDGSGMETTFHVGLRGCAPEDASALEKLVLTILARLAREGISERRLEAAFTQLEYMRLEIAPLHPLHVMETVFEGWLYGVDPLRYLSTREDIAALRQHWMSDPLFFQRLIERRLLQNPHRLTLAFRPDGGLLERQRDEQLGRMAQRTSELGAEGIRAVAAEVRRLEEWQRRPDSPEALACLPHLALEDVPATPTHIAVQKATLPGGCVLLRADVRANGINYIRLAYDTGCLPPDLLSLVPVYAALSTHIGAGRMDYVQMGETLSDCTGDISMQAGVCPQFGQPTGGRGFLSVDFSSLDRTFAASLTTVGTLLAEPRLDDRRRVLDLLTRRRAKLLDGVLERGHQLASLHAAQSLSWCAWLAECWGGIRQIRRVEELLREAEGDWGATLHRLQSLHRHLMTMAPTAMAFVGSDAQFQKAHSWATLLCEGKSTIDTSFAPAQMHMPTEDLAFLVNSDVGFCAGVLPAPPLGSSDAPASSVLCRLLSLGYFWEEIRIGNGAYGGSCSYDPGAQAMKMLSYRDPNPDASLDIFRRVEEQLATADWTTEDVHRAIVGSAKHDQYALRPTAAAGIVLNHHLCGVDDEVRLEFRQRLLAVSRTEVLQVGAKLLQDSARRVRVCVLAGRDALSRPKGPLSELTHQPLLDA